MFLLIRLSVSINNNNKSYFIMITERNILLNSEKIWGRTPSNDFLRIFLLKQVVKVEFFYTFFMF